MILKSANVFYDESNGSNTLHDEFVLHNCDLLEVNTLMQTVSLPVSLHDDFFFVC